MRQATSAVPSQWFYCWSNGGTCNWWWRWWRKICLGEDHILHDVCFCTWGVREHWVKPDRVLLRSRKDVGLWYAIVEFEDATGTQNTIKASSIQIAGCHIFIKEQRPNLNGAVSHGRGRGRARCGCPSNTWYAMVEGNLAEKMQKVLTETTTHPQ